MTKNRKYEVEGFHRGDDAVQRHTGILVAFLHLDAVFGLVAGEVRHGQASRG